MWIERWDVQQAANMPTRERRFDVMVETTVALRGEACTIVDLACGPDVISQRLLTAYPLMRGRDIATPGELRRRVSCLCRPRPGPAPTMAMLGMLILCCISGVCGQAMVSAILPRAPVLKAANASSIRASG
ncbi:hypothetical protein [Jiangella endophytica]|uniref:hypothetical protein n=1 Tax=Jiangella endophytica TaxID=1623398 RepID=UPI00130053BF|nr:hypothetical protein [Jiangella endophytica]